MKTAKKVKYFYVVVNQNGVINSDSVFISLYGTQKEAKSSALLCNNFFQNKYSVKKIALPRLQALLMDLR